MHLSPLANYSGQNPEFIFGEKAAPAQKTAGHEEIVIGEDNPAQTGHKADYNPRKAAEFLGSETLRYARYSA